MKRDVFASSILIASAIAQNTFSASSSNEHVCSKGPGYISVYAGPMISRLGDASETNNLYGFGMSIDLYAGKANSFIFSGELNSSYVQKDTFEDVKRAVKDEAIATVSDAFGIKNTHVKMRIGLGKDFLISKDEAGYSQRKGEDCHCSHFGVGVSMRVKMDYAKNKSAITLTAPTVTGSSISALKKLDSYSFGVGVFGNLYYESDKFIGVLLADAGMSFYGREDYTFAEAIGSSTENILIKTKQDLGGYITVKPGVVYSVSDDIYLGLILDLESDFMGDAKLREDTVSSTTKFPTKTDAEFTHPLSKGMRGSLNFIALYSRK